MRKANAIASFRPPFLPGLVCLLLFALPSPADAGPNAGGVLVLHDTGRTIMETSGWSICTEQWPGPAALALHWL